MHTRRLTQSARRGSGRGLGSMLPPERSGGHSRPDTVPRGGADSGDRGSLATSDGHSAELVGGVFGGEVALRLR
jgi:hypothetical protein